MSPWSTLLDGYNAASDPTNAFDSFSALIDLVGKSPSDEPVTLLTIPIFFLGNFFEQVFSAFILVFTVYVLPLVLFCSLFFVIWKNILYFFRPSK